MSTDVLLLTTNLFREVDVGARDLVLGMRLLIVAVFRHALLLANDVLLEQALELLPFCKLFPSLVLCTHVDVLSKLSSNCIQVHIVEDPPARVDDTIGEVWRAMLSRLVVLKHKLIGLVEVKVRVEVCLGVLLLD